MNSEADNVRYIVGLGDPIIDIIAETNEETLKKYGLDWGKTVMTTPESVGFYDVIESQPEVTYVPGGSVTNSIRVASVK